MHRVFCEWEQGAWISSADPDFSAGLAELVESYGPPSSVEFRAKGEGYAPVTPCEDCGKPYAECSC